ncbi:helix-turn-helix transcriptional regulator [Fundidesulfovibrio terrae]|uniref:helix-turn-helix transcriptional regulator n=1 Tax=Fundidesulfovibrio terrae TaxID=2922866 RepID=UPI001FAFDC15|nr:helix-turn-helix domain-containing protein [Fundidesulfovibrio terrae]
MRHHDIEAHLRPLISGTPPQGSTRLPYVGAVSCITGHRLRSVSLPHSACVLVLKGQKTLYLGEDSLSVREGDMFLLPAQCEVTIENKPSPRGAGYLALCLSLCPDTVARVAAAYGVPDVPEVFSLHSMRVRTDAPLLGSLAHLLDMAVACPGNERLLSLCMEAFVLLVSERTPCFPALWRAEDAWRARCARLVSVDPARGWTALEVAGRLGVSERTLRRNLAKEGAGLRQVLKDVRLNAALSLLQAGHSNVAEAASRCGYDSPSRFAVLFRERFGVRPSDIARFTAGTAQDLAGSEQTGRGLAC